MRSLKLTVVGDKGVGKTSLLKTYTFGAFPEGEYVSTVFPYLPDEDYVYSKTIDYSGVPLLLAMWDRVYNQKEDQFMRALQYDNTDIFLLCFSVTDKTSLGNALSVWRPEITKHCPKSSCLLVGLKKDHRETREGRHTVIPRSVGQNFAERIGALGYLECSAMTRDGIREVFSLAVQIAMGHLPRPKRKKRRYLFNFRLLNLIRLL